LFVLEIIGELYYTDKILNLIVFDSLQVHSIVTTGENSVSAELAFVVNYTDNDATYKCEVTHPALTVPLMKTQKLKVLCKSSTFTY